MDELDALRLLRIPSEDSLLQASSAAEITLEDSHYASLQSELESEAQNLEAESWSLTVDQNYLNSLSKEAIKRQDVIYELIQTEVHHVRTLKILLQVYMHELRKSFLIEEGKLEWFFMGIESLLSLHQHFLNHLKFRQKQSQEQGSPNSYQITQLGDILNSQFSGPVGEKMRDCYTVFCSHHNDAMTFYREQMQNKKLQILIRKMGQLTLVRRLGIPECFLLVTQRIMKYPVLVERIIQNTEAGTEEYKALVEGLALIKNAITYVNTQVSEYEKATRLREIILRLETKSQGRMINGNVIRREDLLRGNQSLLYEGTVVWKSSGRGKEIHAVLLSDMLLLLQEKDQKFVFVSVDNRPPVVSLERLIVREVAREEKAFFLISNNPTTTPEMYEIHTTSKEECINWRTVLGKVVASRREELMYQTQLSKLKHCQELLKDRDDIIKQALRQKQVILAKLYQDMLKQEPPCNGLLLLGDTSDRQHGETHLNAAINEVENLQNLLCSWIKDPNLQMEQNKKPERFRGVENSTATNNSHLSHTVNAEEDDDHWQNDNIPVYHSHATFNLRPESPEDPSDDSTDEETDYPSEPNLHSHLPDSYQIKVFDAVLLLAQRLYSLQEVIVQQDSHIELQHIFQSMNKQPPSFDGSSLLEQEMQRSQEKHKEDLTNLRKQQAQHQEEQQRLDKERELYRNHVEGTEKQLQQREEECKRREDKLNEEKAELKKLRENYQQDLERLRETTQSVEKEQERLMYEREKLEKIKSKYIPGNYDNPTMVMNLYSNPSFRGSVVNGAPQSSIADEIPPKVPPRKESILAHNAKIELPIHLCSTVNEGTKSSAVQQQIPTKLAVFTKGKEKVSKTKANHQRAHSAASIDVNQVVPIRPVIKEGGSLRAKRNPTPHSVNFSETFRAPGSAHNLKPSPSSASNKPSSSSSSDGTPPAPPPFPKEVLKKGKEYFR